MKNNCGNERVNDVISYLKDYDAYCAENHPKAIAHVKKLKKSEKYGSAESAKTLAKMKHTPKPDKPGGIKNILTTVLTSITTEAGFGEKIAIPLSFANAESFRSVIQEGTLMKDPTVPNWHGEHTHRLQWAMIVLGGVVNNAFEMYKYIGSVVYEKNKDCGLWDTICDRDGGEAPTIPFKSDKELGYRDFRSPELLTQYICLDTTLQFSLLTPYLSARVKKRQMGVDKYDYVAKKIFEKKYSELNVQEVAKVKEFVALNWIHRG
jgi:hypothetical protein